MNETDFIKIYTQSDPAGGRALRVSTVYSDSSGIYTASDPNGGRVLKVSLIGGMGTAITVVTNYSALPPANQQTGKFYWCQEPQGTWWLPGSLGGTYYPRGLYYSNGTAWEYMDVPFEATQAEVDAGVDNSKFVTPLTFANASKWSNFPYTKDADDNVFYLGVTATLGTGCNQNVFHQDAISNVLGEDCKNNTFEQEANDNELGNGCKNNTFKQGASGFTFGNTLQNVTIEAGVTGDVYTTLPDYAFLYNNTYPATIFFDGTDNFHKYYDVANDQIVLTNLSTLAVSYIGGAGGGGSTIQKGTASGTDTYTTTITGVTSYTDGDAYLIRFTNGNTTGSTLNINALGAKTLYRNNDGALIGGDIWADGEMLCIFNSTLDGFQCIGTSPNSLFAYVTNADSVTINKGQPVYAFGAAGNRMSVKMANNTSDATSAKTVGIVYSTSIAANQKGIIIIQGMLEGLSSFPLSTWADGDTVYLGATAGSKTNVKPYAPNHLVYLGTVTTASNGSAGRMYVKVQNGYELDELHDVAAQTPSNNNGLFYNSTTGLWTARLVAATDIDANVSNTEFSYLNGVTSAIQTQLDSKQASSVSFNRQTASYTLAASDVNKMVEMNVATANNLTVPVNSSVSIAIGSIISVSQYGAGQTTIVAASGVTLRSVGSWLKIAARYGVVSLLKVGTDEWYVYGALTA